MKEGIIRKVYHTGKIQIGLLECLETGKMRCYVIDDAVGNKRLFSVGERVSFDTEKSLMGFELNHTKPTKSSFPETY